MLLLENYKPPTLACALNEVLSLLVGDGSSNMPTIVAPFFVADTKLKMENRTSFGVDNISVYGLQVGVSSGLTKALITNLQGPPPSLQIFHEELACLLQLARVLKMPTLVIIGKKGQKLHRKTSEEDLEVRYKCHMTVRPMDDFHALNMRAASLCYLGCSHHAEVTKRNRTVFWAS